MRIEQEVADGASKQASRYYFILIRECVPEFDLFVERSTSASLAAELPVECVELFGGRCEFVVKPLNSLQSKFRIHFDERHALMVEQ